MAYQNLWGQKIRNFMVGKSSLQEIATLAIIPEISDSKIWSIPDYPGELTALQIFFERIV